MKRFLITIFALFFAVTVSAQIQAGASSAMAAAEKLLGGMVYSTNISPSVKIVNKVGYEKRPYGAPSALKYNKLYYLGDINDSTAIFSHTRGIYFGSYIQEKNKPTFLRSGFGIDRIQDDSSIDDVVKYEFFVGFYKKNRRNGEGFLVRNNGTVVKARWKRGRMVLRSKTDPAPEEIEKVNDFVRQLKNLM